MTELKSLTLKGTKYDSFIDETARTAIEELQNSGTPGIGISDAEINSEGELILTFTDGTSKNLGRVVGTNDINVIPTTVTATGQAVEFEEAIGKVKVKGNIAVDNDKSVKLVHSGKNLLNITSSNLTGTDVQYQDGWIVVERTEPNSNEFSNAMIPISDAAIFPGKKYYVYIEFHEENNINGVSNMALSQASTTEPFNDRAAVIEGVNLAGKKYRYTLSTKETFDSNVVWGIRCIIYWAVNSAYGKWKYRVWYEMAPDNVIINEEKTISNAEFIESQPIRTYEQILSAGHTGEYAWEDITPIDGVNVLQVSHGEITVSYEKNKVIQIKDNLSGKKLFTMVIVFAMVLLEFLMQHKYQSLPIVYM